MIFGSKTSFPKYILLVHTRSPPQISTPDLAGFADRPHVILVQLWLNKREYKEWFLQAIGWCWVFVETVEEACAGEGSSA